MNIQPYLYFDGRCDEAFEFYKSAVDAKVEFIMRFKDSPQPVSADQFSPGFEEKVMHATLRIGDSIILASDGHCHGKANFSGFGLAINASSDDEAKRIFTGLCDGGKITMLLGKTFFSSSFGMVTDKFGVPWLVIVHLR